MDKDKLFAALDKRITTTVDLGEFADHLQGQTVEVWTNPSRKIAKEIKAWTEAHNDSDLVPLWVGTLIGLSNEDALLLYEKDSIFLDWLTQKVTTITQEYAQKKVPSSAN